MAVSVKDLITKREKIKAAKQTLYDVETSIGTITCRVPSIELISEVWDMKDSGDGNKQLVFQCCVEPNLKDKDLLEAYDVAEPFDIVSEIFKAGEVAKLAGHLLKLAGFTDNITSRIHKEIKN